MVSIVLKKIFKYTWNLNLPVETNEDRCAYVWVKYFFALSLALSLIWTAYQFADLINDYCPLTSQIITWFQTISAAIGAVGFWGSAGWTIQTFSGESPAEILDKKIAKVLSLFGFLATFASFHLIPST